MGQKQIRVYDKNLTLLGIVEDYEEASYTRSFFTTEDFSIKINRNIPNADLLAEQNRIVIFGDDARDSGVIMSLSNEIDEDGKGSQYLTVTGRDLRCLFERRAITELNSEDAFYLSGPAETVIKTIVATQCGSLSTDPARVFSRLVVATDQARGGQYSVSTKYTSVYEECAIAATQGALGWYVYPDVDAKTFVLDCELGIDRSTSQSVNPYCIFDPDLESAKSINLEDQINDYRNLVYVGGDGAGALRTIYKGYDGTEPTDFDRFEMFVDASGLSTTADLQNEATSKLEEYKKSISIEGQGLVKSPFVYKQEYNVGDIATVRFNETEQDVRILSVTESYTQGEYEISQTLGKPVSYLADQIGALSSGATATSGSSESGTNVSGMKNGVTVFDLSAGSVTMDGSECIYNVLSIEGALTADRTLTLYLDTTRLYGRKVYTAIVSASGNYYITCTTGISGKTNAVLEASGVTRAIQLYVDDDGNVSRSEREENEIDGGSAVSVYLSDQILDGGGA